MYEILGMAAFVEDISVVIVSTVVTPSWTRAGLAFCKKERPKTRVKKPLSFFDR